MGDLDAATGSGEPPWFGPYHRLETVTQTAADAARQEATGEIWGRTPRGSAWPQVQAFRGPLPPGHRGMEFETPVAPDPGGHPWEVRWSGGGRRDDVRTEGEFAVIPCRVTRNMQKG